MIWDFLHDVGIGLLLVFLAFIAYQWSRWWLKLRYHGHVVAGAKSSEYTSHPVRWRAAYRGYKVWTWIVAVAAQLAAFWQLSLAGAWFAKFVFSVVTL